MPRAADYVRPKKPRAKPKAKAKAKAVKPVLRGRDLWTPMVDRAVEELSWLGRDNTEIIKALGIATSTFYVWLQKYPTMSEALESGREKALIPVIKSMYRNAIGYEHEETVVKWNKETGFATMDVVKRYQPNQAAAEFILTNRQGGQWRKKSDGVLDVNLTVRRALLELADGVDA
jgi:hypothetical protein